MKYLPLILVALVSIKCGSVGKNISDANKCVNNGDSCRDEANDPRYKGIAGTDGSSCSVSKVTAGAKITCTDGTQVIIPNPSAGPTGATGPQGSAGPQGPKGDSGASCSVSQAVNGSVILCEDGSQVLVLNGQDGVDGAAGPTGAPGPTGSPAPATAFTVVEMIDPCGDAPGIYDEVLLKLANGKLVASFSDNANGQNTRFSVLSQGSYQTTDGSHCYFSVDSNNLLFNEHY